MRAVSFSWKALFDWIPWSYNSVTGINVWIKPRHTSKMPNSCINFCRWALRIWLLLSTPNTIPVSLTKKPCANCLALLISNSNICISFLPSASGHKVAVDFLVGMTVIFRKYCSVFLIDMEQYTSRGWPRSTYIFSW